MEYRMYVLVEKHLSPIDKGIQAAHAIASYSNIMEHNSKLKEQYKQWCNEDKTIILLNGGTVTDLKCYMDEISKYNVPFAYFKEPDLDNIVTAIAVLVDERVYNKEKYPDYTEWKNPSDQFMDILLYTGTENVIGSDWIKFIGGETNAFLRQLLTTKQLAR